MRWAIAGVAAMGCVLGAGLLYGWLAAAQVDDASGWRTRDLLFLKSAHDRVQADLARQPDGRSEDSLRREQQALLRAMTAIAKPMPADSIPDDVRPLLQPAEAPQTDLLAAVFDAIATEQPADLRIGLAPWRVRALDLADLTVGADLRAPLPRKIVAAKPRAEKPRAEKPPTPQPANSVTPTKAAAVSTR